jgi:cytochrome P450
VSAPRERPDIREAEQVTEQRERPTYSWPEVMAEPYDFYEEIQAESAVHRLEDADGYLITRYDDVVWAARQPERFSSKRIALRDVDPEVAAIADEGYPTVPTVVDNDPPDHTKYRTIGFQAFGPTRLAAYEPQIRLIANDLIDDWIDRGSVEFVSEFASKLPMAVMLTLCGIPRDAAAQIKVWVDDWVQLLMKYVGKDSALDLQRSVVELEKFIAHHLEERKRNPRDDVLSELVHAEIEGDLPLELPHLISIAKIYLTAGTQTTAHTLGSAMWLLSQHPDVLERVSGDLSLVPRLIDETLRLQSAAQWSPRYCVADTEVGGTLIPAGSRVLLVWASASRDASVFAEPATFDIDRPNVKRHVGFGAGPHTCVGAPLGRLEARIALQELLPRITNVRLAVSPKEISWRQPVPAIRGPIELPLLFDPVR